MSNVTGRRFRTKPECLFSTDDIAAAGSFARDSSTPCCEERQAARPMRLPGNRLAWRGRVLPADWLDALEPVQHERRRP